ncbi:hypothetical protein GWI33_005719 [Rhynchophorus ferrugineus]|uniref:Uncharacterized protein n=1 Tax=Rhynchophorus ferrugineus TaxID=354439 RepID=A0A834IG14_RHYFE|nr:hypothetical protein GWI33_005719 [Rhynchophorus ferrugineus]
MPFQKLKKCFTSPKKLLKLAILILCIFFSIYQVVKCVEKLMHPPISTYYGFHLNETIRYPSVTVCRSPSFKTDRFSRFGLRRNSDLSIHNAFRFFNFNIHTIEYFLNDTTWTFDELISSLAYNGYGYPIADVKIVEFHSVTKGRCFTLTPKSTSRTLSISGGWWFYLKHNFTVRSLDLYGMSTAGFHIHLHDDNEIMTSEVAQENNFMEYIYLEAAEDMRMNLKIQEFTKINTNESPCVHDNLSYSKSKCQELCVQKQIAQRLNCTLPWLWLLDDDSNLPQCSDATSVQQLISLFQPHFIAIYCTSNLITYMNEMLGYNVNGFVSDIGGSLGFLLGLSVIGFITVMEKILASLIRSYFKNKTKTDVKERDLRSGQLNNLKHMNKNPEYLHRKNDVHLYDNLRDFESDDFKCYQNTLVVSDNRY